MEYNEMIRALAKQFGMEAEPFAAAVKAQCFQGGACSDYQLTQLLMVCADKQLNPFAPGEVYAFVAGGKLNIGVGINGWIKIAHRHKDFAGYAHRDVFEQDEFVGVEMTMYRRGWEHPGRYTAYLNEWKTSTWTAQPRHRCFAKSFQECCRFTFDVTEVAGIDDVERVRAAEEQESEPQRVIEHKPFIPADFTGGHATDAGAPTPSRKGRPAGSKNKPKGLAPGEDVRDHPTDQRSKCWVCQFPATQTQDYGTRSFSTCDTHANEIHPDEKAIRDGWVKEKADEREATPVQASGAQAADAAQENGASAVAPDTRSSDAQAAAGLEVIDPSEHPLETFCRAHDVPQRRVDMALSKYGATSVAELTPDQETAILGIFERSLKIAQATA